MTSQNPATMSDADRVALLDVVLNEVRPRDGEAVLILVGGEEAALLWEATVDAFVAGNWVATLLCAQAVCERVLAALVSLHELPHGADQDRAAWERWGLGKLVEHVRAEGWVPVGLLDDAALVCERRKPFGHWRRPLDPGTPMRRTMDEVASDWEADPAVVTTRLLADDAAFAARTALRLYFGNFFGGPYAPAGLAPG